ncbi:MAG: YeeE/YedE family protein [Pelagibacteraceae bacterium]|jgi:hypothetical protein|nr:YeeE/YedE family protein [Pelagibacteraceae bacterium]MDP6440913.1 YeeE/YedE family protein [Pelagibacteraceae bacterium]MDP6784967.1 YeeE/YedE family protein [Alphaproteobacteria bacterium]
MNIVNFTPMPAFVGGVIIGLAVVVFFIGNGRLAGISSIVNNLLTSKQDKGDNFLFLIGLVVGPIIFSFSTTNEIPFFMTNSLPLIVIGGLLVGIGTKVAGGCTSGHGICGIARSSLRSVIATVLFMVTAILTVAIIGIK